jgi:tetratricopeptide (TPR) repeat protein
MIYPRYRVFMDMDSYFTDEDFFLGWTMFAHPDSLRTVLERYDPDFISVPYTFDRFPRFIRDHPRYVPVFFDDYHVLYANERRHPDVAAAHRLRAIDPYTLIALNAEAALLRRADRAALMAEAQQLLASYPQGGLANYLMAILLMDEQRHPEVLPYVQRILRTFPEAPTGYHMEGDIQRSLGAAREAVRSYRKALSREPDERSRMPIYRKLGLAYWDLKQYGNAYEAFRKSVDAISPATTVEDLYTVGAAALLAGRMREAESIFHYLLDSRIPADDTVWRRKVDAALAQAATAAPGAR